MKEEVSLSIAAGKWIRAVVTYGSGTWTRNKSAADLLDRLEEQQDYAALNKNKEFYEVYKEFGITSYERIQG